MINTAKICRVVTALTCISFSAWGMAATSLNLPDAPLFVGTRATPMVMLDISRDHQLFYKAYNDYTDLDHNGVLDAAETTYRDSFEYYGYFDPQKCYDYDTGVSRFVPKAATASGDNRHYCSAKWSGNFLNWVSMSRIDIMRKVLYGGYRSTDSAASSSASSSSPSLTVLERANLPTDAHAWAKYYNGSDIAKLTPYSTLSTATTVVSGTGVKVNTTSSGAVASVKGLSGTFYPGDQVQIKNATGVKTSYGVVNTYSGTDLVLHALSHVGSFSSNEVITVENLSRVGISFCNATIGGSSDFSQSTTAPPSIRVAAGNYSLWGANERWQCYWRDEKDGGADDGTPAATNGNSFAASGLAASRRNPKKSEALSALGAAATLEMVARVEVCNASLLGTEVDECKYYGSNLKPVGLLQQYGESRFPRIFFGLMTPTYSLNVSGGVLRKAIGKSLSGNVMSDGTTADPNYDEINANTGQFQATILKPDSGGIIYNLNRLRIDKYQYSDGTYDTSSCTFQRTGIVPTTGTPIGNQVREGNCTSWGNPMSELYMESLRYFAGLTKTAAFSNSTMPRDDGSGTVQMKMVTPWVDPITSNNYCASLNVLIFNASVSTNDGDQVTGFGGLKGAPDAVTLTKSIGDYEGLTGGSPKSVFVGNNGTVNDGICTAKAISNLGKVGGLCPEAPSQAGTYLMAGMAYRAHTSRIRDVTGVTLDATTDLKSWLKVTTYGVALATNVPRIPVKVGSNTVTIQPAYRLDLGGTNVGTGTIVDFRVVDVSADGSHGKFYVNWEDSNFGGDYDQDVIGTLEYQVTTISGVSTIAITTKVISQSTVNPQGFGYTISGTSKDGVHFHSGILGFNFTDSTGVTGCSNCGQSDAATTVTYNVTGTSTVTELKDPLFYAAKYGGFKELDSVGKPTPITATSIPDKISEWDAVGTDGSAGADGLPDTYFYVNDPSFLKKSLANAFDKINQSAAGAAVATSSTKLTTATTVYQGRFDPGYWTGDLRALTLTYSGTTSSLSKVWSAADKLTSETGRVIFTYDPISKVGEAFQWASLTTTQQTQLTLSGISGSGTKVLNYVRGSSANEGSGVNAYRIRDTTKLGDIIDSSPILVGVPSSGSYHGATIFPAAYSTPGYDAFKSSQTARGPVVYVGANDGMLHAFDGTSDASGGKELFAYIPGIVLPNLKTLVSQNYSHKYFVDGSPEVVDAELSPGSWATVLTGGLRAGGRGIYALNVTNPSSMTTEAAAKASVMWEFGSNVDADMGFVFERPLVAKLRSGNWVVITGNGYNSASGEAKLFIINLNSASGAAPTYSTITTGVGSATDTNGLGGVAGIDIDNDGFVDYVYAGDLKGNMWKFDLADNSVRLLTVACTDKTAATAGSCSTANRQPITWAPALTPHPSDSTQVLVYFGTGKYLEMADLGDAQQQSMYAVWDVATDASKTKIPSVYRPMNALLPQVLSPDPTNASFRQVTSTAIDWTSRAGWYEDFLSTGERVSSSPQIFSGNVIYTTFVPVNTTCGTNGGCGWLMVTDYSNGGLRVSFDFNNDGSPDTLAAGAATCAAFGGITLVSDGELVLGLGNQTTDDTPGCDATGICTTTFKTPCFGSSCHSSSSSNSSSSSSSSAPSGGFRRLNWREIVKPD